MRREISLVQINDWFDVLAEFYGERRERALAQMGLADGLISEDEYVDLTGDAKYVREVS